MCEVKYHVKLPIFIARQWIRHITANVNGILQGIQFLIKNFISIKQISCQSTSNRQVGRVLKDSRQKNLRTFKK